MANQKITQLTELINPGINDDLPIVDNTGTPTTRRIKPHNLARGGYSVTSMASSGTPTPTGNVKRNEYYLTALAVGATFGVPSGTPENGNAIFIRIRDNGTARTLAWNAIYLGAVGVLPTTTIAGITMYLLFIYNTASVRWEMLARS